MLSDHGVGAANTGGDYEESEAGGHQQQPGEKKKIFDNKGNLIDPKDNCNIYVAGIPKTATEDKLRKLFSQFGSILHVSVIKDYETKQPRGFAYILFKSGKEANLAIEKANQTQPFNDYWKITVEHAKRGEVVTEDTIEKY